MGKLYADELSALPRTYSWALRANVDKLANAIASTASLPLLAVGSGGALTTAHFAAILHQRCTGKVSKAVTPLEMDSLAKYSRDCAVILFTAGGNNPDVLGSFRRLVLCEPRRFIVVCGRESSPLSIMAKRFWYVDFIGLKLPSGKDGFLATNSLLAFSVFLRRAYGKAFSFPNTLPQSFRALVYSQRPRKQYIADLKKRCAQLWTRENLVILFGPNARCGAVDLESKLMETALCAVQTADYRNFAHGRHHWLAKRGQVTGVLAFVTKKDVPIAARTLRFLPKNIPISQIEISSVGFDANLEAIVIAFFLTGFAGEARGINPGKPGVPAFGRKIYHLNAFKRAPISSQNIPRAMKVAIERKSRNPIDNLKNYGSLGLWVDYYQKFIRTIRSVPFCGVVLDYDGTLCDPRSRFVGWQMEASLEVVRLLKAGILVGIATGRGESVRKDLREGIPKNLWNRLVVGYLNGADVAFLSDDLHPTRTKQIYSLRKISRAIKSHPMIRRFATCKNYPMQISVRPKGLYSKELVWDNLKNLKLLADNRDIKVVQSSHSVDILASSVSKSRVVDKIRSLLNDPDARILCIGDQGKWPGNDSELLSEAHALSVDTVSSDLNTCWNIAPAGYRGPQATMFYLKCLVPQEGQFRLQLAQGRRTSQ